MRLLYNTSILTTANNNACLFVIGPKVHVPDGELDVRGTGAALFEPHLRVVPVPVHVLHFFLLFRLLQASGDGRPRMQLTFLLFRSSQCSLEKKEYLKMCRVNVKIPVLAQPGGFQVHHRPSSHTFIPCPLLNRKQERLEHERQRSV